MGKRISEEQKQRVLQFLAEGHPRSEIGEIFKNEGLQISKASVSKWTRNPEFENLKFNISHSSSEGDSEPWIPLLKRVDEFDESFDEMSQPREVNSDAIICTSSRRRKERRS
jgi:hypothetical protein